MNAETDKLVQDVDNKRIIVAEEQIAFDKKLVETGKITVSKTVESTTLDIPLETVHTAYEIEKSPKDEIVEKMPATRYEGDDIIIPVVREEEVVIKRLVLVEEIRLRKKVTATTKKETIELRRENVRIDKE